MSSRRSSGNTGVLDEPVAMPGRPAKRPANAPGSSSSLLNFRTALDCVSNAIMTVDRNFIVTYVNQTTMTMLNSILTHFAASGRASLRRRSSALASMCSIKTRRISAGCWLIPPICRIRPISRSGPWSSRCVLAPISTKREITSATSSSGPMSRNAAKSRMSGQISWPAYRTISRIAGCD